MSDIPKNAALYSPAVVRALLTRHGLRADKAFGQNFLIDGNILNAIAEAARLDVNDTVLEIGPGLGVLTRELARRAGRVVSVELDRRLLPVLAETLQGLDNVEVLHGDGLEFDMTQLPQRSLLVANLPYNVATPMLVKALESSVFKRLVFLVQKEVAQRLSAKPGDSAFGALSLIVKHYGQAHILRDVKPGSFFPPPEVTSSVVSVELEPGVGPDPDTFRLIRLAFKHRRKTLKKNLVMAGYEAARAEAALHNLGVDPRVRAEALELADFRELANYLFH